VPRFGLRQSNPMVKAGTVIHQVFYDPITLSRHSDSRERLFEKLWTEAERQARDQSRGGKQMPQPTWNICEAARNQLAGTRGKNGSAAGGRRRINPPNRHSRHKDCADRLCCRRRAERR
jgi:hypothetical protein